MDGSGVWFPETDISRDVLLRSKPTVLIILGL